MGNVPEGDIGLVEQAGSSNVVQQQQVNQRIQLSKEQLEIQKKFEDSDRQLKELYSKNRFQVLEAVLPPSEDLKPYWVFQQVGIRKIDVNILLIYFHRIEEQRKNSIVASVRHTYQQGKNSVDSVTNVLFETGNAFKLFASSFIAAKTEVQQLRNALEGIRNNLNALASILPPNIRLHPFDIKVNYAPYIKQEETLLKQLRIT